VLDAAGPQAGHIERLTAFLVVTSAVAFALVLVALVLSVRRGRRRRAGGGDADVTATTERRLGRVVAGASAATIVVLFAYLVVTVRTGRALATLAAPDPLTVEIIGHQWWWEVRYRDPIPQRWLTTANELHIPVGRPVQVITTANDVIHSFWVPELHGKQDLIPGYKNAMWLRADAEGEWRGQCTEFCGHQHAFMGLVVVAESPAKFDAWYASQLASPPEPSDSAARRGRDVFMNGGCVMCHAIGGTPAGSSVGPDLTHLASRRTLGAATIPNTRGHLAGWIVDPQGIKPGVKMPPNQLTPDDLNALLDYLQTLR
jgi:cytochrome c oxidase subunit 2